MVIINGLWNTLRGMTLLVMLTVIFVIVLSVSCLVRLLYASAFSYGAGKLHHGLNFPGLLNRLSR